MSAPPDWSYNSAPYAHTNTHLPTSKPHSNLPVQSSGVIDLTTSDNDEDEDQEDESDYDYDYDSSGEIRGGESHPHHCACCAGQKRDRAEFEAPAAMDHDTSALLASWGVPIPNGQDQSTQLKSNLVAHIQAPSWQPPPTPPAKQPKLNHTSADQNTDAESHIQDLKSQVKDLQDFIISQGLLSKVPPSIRQHLTNRPAAASELHRALYRAIDNAQSALDERGGYDPRESGITSDDYSEAMAEFIPDIKRLSLLPDRGLEFAIELVFHLERNSYSDMDSGGCGYGERPSDELADELLCELIGRMRREKGDDGWLPREELEVVRGEAEELEEFGILSYFTKAIGLLQVRSMSQIVV